MKKSFICIMLTLMLLPAIGLFSPDFTLSSIEEFLVENIAFKDEIITLRASYLTLLFNQSGSPQVLMGRNSFLYFDKTLEGFYRYTPLQVDLIADSIGQIEAYLSSHDIGFAVLVAPDKWAVYPENMPYYAVPHQPLDEYSLLMQTLEKRNIRVIDALSILKEQKSRPMYHPTDTHWTQEGALYIYRALMQSYNVPFDDYQDITFTAVPFQGDLERLYAPLKKSSTAFEATLERRYKTKGSMRSVSDSLIRSTCDTNNLKLLVFRDSFGDALFPYIANNVGHLTFSRSFPLNDHLIQEVQPDEVLLILAQRNLQSLLKD